MGNIQETLKRFIGNKNTVTILAVLAGIIILWYFYNYRVDQAITTISVPYAIEAIDTGDKIETDNIGTKELTQNSVTGTDMITNINDLTDKYVCTGTSIPAYGFFYESQVCEKEELPNTVLDNIEDGNSLFALSVNNQTTYANSIMPGDYIDIYLSAIDDDKNYIYGKLIESIEVLAVRDSSGRDVFWDSSAGDSAYLLFSVPEEYSKLLNIALEITGYSIELIPVPRNASYTANPGETKIASDDLRYFIEKHYSSLG